MGQPLDRLERTLVADRPRLVGVAYRITGSRVEAEDIVQEAWLRARRADPATIDRPEAWLTTVVSRLALDSLRSAHHRREAYVGPYLPEPVRTGGTRAAGAIGDSGASSGAAVGGLRRGPGGAAGVAGPVGGGAAHGLGEGADPAELAEQAESLTFGFLRVLDTLEPVERVAFLLADVFDVPYAEIADVVGRSPEACRQVASRARRRVREGRAEHAPPGEAQRVADQLVAALGVGDVAQVVALLSEDVVLVSDGGADFRAARRPVVGPDRVGRFLTYIWTNYVGVEIEPTTLNGEPGIVVRVDGRPVVAIAVRVAAGRVASVHIVVNPDKLTALDLDEPLA